MRWGVAAIASAMIIYVLPVYGAGDETVRVIRSDDQEVILELVVAGFQVSAVDQEGTDYHRVSIPNFGLTTEVGHPQLPVHGVVIGFPEGAKTVLEVLAADFKTLPDYTIAPVPHPEVDEEGGAGVVRRFTFYRDESVYTRDAFYPPEVVRVGFTGKMRDQGVVQVVFSPIQTNPVRREVRFYNRILVRIGFDRGNSGGTVGILGKPEVQPKVVPDQGPVIETPYERVLEDILLNYSAVRRK